MTGRANKKPLMMGENIIEARRNTILENRRRHPLHESPELAVDTELSPFIKKNDLPKHKAK